MFLTLILNMQVFKIACQTEVENNVVDKFNVDLKFIEEWNEKSIEQMDDSLIISAGIK